MRMLWKPEALWPWISIGTMFWWITHRQHWRLTNCFTKLWCPHQTPLSSNKDEYGFGYLLLRSLRWEPLIEAFSTASKDYVESTEKDNISFNREHFWRAFLDSNCKNLKNLRLISNDSSSDTDGQSDIGLHMESFHRLLFCTCNYWEQNIFLSCSRFGTLLKITYKFLSVWLIIREESMMT